MALRHRIGRYSRSVAQASICPRFYKRFVINHAILASTTGTSGTFQGEAARVFNDLPEDIRNSNEL